MTAEHFTINHGPMGSTKLAGAAAMQAHLSAEGTVWQPLFEKLMTDQRFRRIPLDSRELNGQQLASAFKNLQALLDNPSKFNRETVNSSGVPTPPPSSSLEGQLILGLLQSGSDEEAISAYTYFLSTILPTIKNQREFSRLIQIGEMLTVSAKASAALPYRKTTSNQISALLKSAKAQVEGVGSEVHRAEKINADLERNLAEQQNRFARRMERIEKIAIGREHRRTRRNAQKMGDLSKLVNEQLFRDHKIFMKFSEANQIRQNQQQKEFDRLLGSFKNQLQFKEPAALWAKRANEHTDNADRAVKKFFWFTGIAVSIGLLLPVLLGDYISDSFFVMRCDYTPELVCQRSFSAKGPLTVSGLLLVMSLALWVIRLQYRVYLSERHLSLDASEKKAFAQTFLAIKAGADTDAGNEAIVLASLFRPTQDGIIRDDETGLDLSIVAALAKQFGRGNN